MTLWERLEEYLYERDFLGGSFNSIALANDVGISGKRASALIQSYLGAQRRPNARTFFVLSRRGRTSAAMWHVGARASDVRGLTRQCLDDMAIKVTDALQPDLRRIATLNPRCANLVNATADSFVANLRLLEVGLESA